MPNLHKYVPCKLDNGNSIDLKLFPEYPSPPDVSDYHVPVLILDLAQSVDKHWDLTMRKVFMYNRRYFLLSMA